MHAGVQTYFEAESDDTKYQLAKVNLKELQDVVTLWLSLQSHLYAKLCVAVLLISLRIAARQLSSTSRDSIIIALAVLSISDLRAATPASCDLILLMVT